MEILTLLIGLVCGYVLCDIRRNREESARVRKLVDAFHRSRANDIERHLRGER